MSTLLLVHAHPDDESISTGGVMRRAHDQGKRVVLVTCTGGEEGEIHNFPDPDAIRPRLAEVRAEELARACAILGVDRQVFLGYRDSGMAGTPENQHPASFHQADRKEAAARLAVILREERPEVVVTYTADGTYGHPDHVKSHFVTMAALDLLREEGWEPQRVFLHALPEGYVARMAEEAKKAGVDWEANTEVRLIGTPDAEITMAVNVADLSPLKHEAYLAHTSQNPPDSPFSSMAGEILVAALGTEHFVQVRGGRPEAGAESDLFGGVTSA